MDCTTTRQGDAAQPRPEAAGGGTPAGAFTRILVGFDSAAGSCDALRLGARLAEWSGAELILATVPAGGNAAEELREIAAAKATDLIVIGSTHRGPVGRVLPGSVGERVLDGAPCAVAIAPRGLAERGFELRRILVACDGSRESLAAVQLAAAIAAAGEAQLTLLGVVEMRFDLAGFPRPPAPAEVARLERTLQRARHSIPPPLSPAIRQVHGVPAEMIAAAGHDADLLVLGSRGRYGPLRRTLLGSVAAKLARSAPCPTLVTPA